MLKNPKQNEYQNILKHFTVKFLKTKDGENWKAARKKNKGIKELQQTLHLKTVN